VALRNQRADAAAVIADSTVHFRLEAEAIQQKNYVD